MCPCVELLRCAFFIQNRLHAKVHLVVTRPVSGVLPGGESLVEVPAVGDWEKDVAREVKA